MLHKKSALQFFLFIVLIGLQTEILGQEIQEGTLYESVRGDSTYQIRLKYENSTFWIINNATPDSNWEPFKELEESSFKNALREVFADSLLSDSLLSIVTLDLLNKIEIGEIEKNLLREGVQIANLQFRHISQRVPILTYRVDDCENRCGGKDPKHNKIPIDPLSDELRRRNYPDLVRKKVTYDTTRTQNNITITPDTSYEWTDTLTSKSRFNLLFHSAAYRKQYYHIATKDNFLKLRSVQIAFENGAIKDILIKGKLHYEGENVTFQNIYPIPVDSPKDIQRINRQGSYIFEYQKSEIKYAVDIADVLDYDRIVAMTSGSYSPIDTVVFMNDISKFPVRLVKKPYFDNFDVRVYTDVTGFEETNPNGLVQLETQYDLLFAKRPVGIGVLGRVPLVCRIPKINDFLNDVVVLTRVSPFLTLSKIEENLNTMPLDSSGESNAVEIMQFSNLNLGIDLGVASFLRSNQKYNINLKVGLVRTNVDSTKFFTSKTTMVDSNKIVTRDTTIVPDEDRFSFYIMPEFNVHIIDGARLDFDVTYGISYFRGLFDDIEMRDGKWMSKYEMSLNVHPDSQSQDKSLFLRARLVALSKSIHNFTLQLGYSTPISKIFKSGRDRLR